MDKKLYRARIANYQDEYLNWLLDRSDIERGTVKYTHAYSLPQAETFFKKRYPRQEILEVMEVVSYTE